MAGVKMRYSSFLFGSLFSFRISFAYLHPRAEIKLNCPEATGSVNCDWSCYDKCTTPFGPYLSVPQMIGCLNEMPAKCTIPGTALLTLKPNWFCSVDGGGDIDDGDNEERLIKANNRLPNNENTVARAYSGYVIEIPKFESSSAKLRSAYTGDISVDVAGTFDSITCQSSSSYVVAENHGQTNIAGEFNLDESGGQPAPRCSRDVGIINTNALTAIAGFGPQLLNLNFTQWVMDYEAGKQRMIGDEPVVIDLATPYDCWAPATNITIYHATQFTIDSYGFDSVSAAVSLTGTSVLLMASLALITEDD